MTTHSTTLTHAEIRDRITPPGAFEPDFRRTEVDRKGPRKVLLVEDDQDYRSLLALVLEQRGYDVRQAEDGQEGLHIAQTTPVDMVLVDFDLPILHGLEVVRQLRQQSRFGALPIVMMTSYGSRVHDSAISAGCNEFLAKPIDFLALDGILHKFAPTN